MLCNDIIKNEEMKFQKILWELSSCQENDSKEI